MKRIKKRRAFELCWNERRALAVVDSPFAVRNLISTQVAQGPFEAIRF